MKQAIIIFTSILLASLTLSAPTAHPLPIEPKEKRQDDTTITYTRDPLTSTDSSIPGITDSSFPSPTDTLPFSSVSTDSSYPTDTIPFSSTVTDSSIPSSTYIIPYSSTPPDSISIIPTSSWGGGTTIENSGTLTFPGGATQTFTFGSQTITLTFPGSPLLSLAAEPDQNKGNEKRQVFVSTAASRSRISESILPASTHWDNGGPALSLTLPAEAVRATGIPDVQVRNEEAVNVVEVIRRQTDTITWDSTLPVTTYWGDQTITIGGQTITFGDGPGGPGMSLTIDAVGERVTAEPEDPNV